MIKVSSISKHFAHDRNVLNNISAVFKPSQTTMVIGGSGAGKTVLMKCIIGLLEPDEGDVFYNEQNFTKMNFSKRKFIRKEIGMLFQNGALFDSMTVEENILFPLEITSIKFTKKEKLNRVNYCLERVGLPNSNHLLPAELSGGMKKRVGIARAIVLEPKYLFVDEPNSGLDPKNSLMIDNLVQDLTKELKITTIIITHDMNSIFELGDYIYFIHDGQIHWEGTKKEIFSTKNEVLDDFLCSRETFKLLKNK